MRHVALIATLLAAVHLGNPQGPVTAVIEGIVVGPNGPLPGAEVTALWNPPPASYRPETVPRATTSADGKFSMSVSPGAYRVTARAPGFVSQTFGARRAGQDGANTGSVVQVDSQERLTGLKITLTQEAILTGRIATTDGQPLVRIEVAALKKRFTATGSLLEVSGKGQTDDRGEYRISGLTPGAYIIGATGLNPVMTGYEAFVAARSNTAPPPPPSAGAFGPRYYPDADHWSQATAIEVQSGAETRDINFLVPKRNVYAVRGRLIGLPAEPRFVTPGIRIMPANVEYATTLVTSGNAYKPDGTFELTGVAPGFHWVIAQIPATLTTEQRALLSTPGADLSQLPQATRGAALVHVTNSDVENVELVIVRDLEVSGRLSIEGEQFDFSRSGADFVLELGPTDSLGNGASKRFSVLDADGEFIYKNLLPTAYRLVISALPAPFYVKEARYGDIDGLSESINLMRPSSTRLNIVVARGAEVTGTVIDGEARTLQNQRVVLIPSEPKRFDLYRSAATNGAGEFKISGVAPGVYQAFSWEVLEDFQYVDEAFVSRYRDRGTYVQVVGTGKTDIQVRLIR